MLGWYLFGGLVAVLLFIDARLYRYYLSAENVKESDQDIRGDDKNSAACTDERYKYLVIVAVTAILVSFGPVAAYKVSNQTHASDEDYVINLPAGDDGWEGPLVSNDDWMPVYHGAIIKKRSYQKYDDKVTLYIGYYPLQKQGEELINDLNRINNKDIWRTRYPRARLKQVNDQQVLEQMLEKNDGKQRLVWYWYKVAGLNTANKYEAKLLQVLGLLTGDQQAFVTAVAVDNSDDMDHVRKVLREYVTVMEKPLNTLEISKAARME
jgi:EpsI family protein